MSTLYTGGPAFPQDYEHVRVLAELASEMTDKQLLKATKQLAGMTLRQYAAIHLKVPNSGDDWLDEMIATSVRNDLAAKVLQVALAGRPESSTAEQLVKLTYIIADEMVKAQKGNAP
jgi:hypothetical protein